MSEENEYVPAEQAIELLGEKPSKFYYHAVRGDIRTESPAKPGKGKKNNRYLVSDILKLKVRLVEQRQKRKPEPLIDWIHASDLPAGIKLAQQLYDDNIDLAEAAVYEGWRKNNHHLTLAAFSQDRQECYASIQLVPLDEQIILDVLSNRRTENSILPDEIRAYNEPGPYILLGTSALCLDSRPELLLRLLRSYMQYWEKQYPERYITKIYAQAMTDSGNRLTQHLLMSPRYDLAYNAYELDLSRPAAAHIIKNFKQRLADIAPLPPVLHWPPIVPTSPAPAVPPQPPTTEPQPQVNVVSSAVRSLATTGRTKSTRPELPDGWVTWRSFADLHNIPQTTVDADIKAGLLQVETDGWKQGRIPVNQALNPDQQHAFYDRYHDRQRYKPCSDCPHKS